MATPKTPSERLLQFFEYDHLPSDLRAVSRAIALVAHTIDDALPGESPEKTAGLRKLLEAKDCFVRAALERRDAPTGGEAA